MRCCIQSLQAWVQENPLVESGQEVPCLYTEDPSHGFVLRGNTWKVRLFDGETKQRIPQS
jgi:hypothetical protein